MHKISSLKPRATEYILLTYMVKANTEVKPYENAKVTDNLLLVFLKIKSLKKKKLLLTFTNWNIVK